MEVFQDLMAEASADMSDVAPSVVFAHGEAQGAEERPGAPWRRKAGNHHFLSPCHHAPSAPYMIGSTKRSSSRFNCCQTSNPSLSEKRQCALLECLTRTCGR